MNVLTILIFTVAALLGIYLISYILRDKNTPKGLAIIHGSIAAVGILLLVILSFYYTNKPYISLLLFILAAAGGFIMIYRDITGRSLPKWLALGHGLLAVIGFIFLILWAFFSN